MMRSDKGSRLDETMYRRDTYVAENAEERKQVVAEIRKNEDGLDQIRGSLIGGAVGDAL